MYTEKFRLLEYCSLYFQKERTHMCVLLQYLLILLIRDIIPTYWPASVDMLFGVHNDRDGVVMILPYWPYRT